MKSSTQQTKSKDNRKGPSFQGIRKGQSSQGNETTRISLSTFNHEKLFQINEEKITVPNKHHSENNTLSFKKVKPRNIINKEQFNSNNEVFQKIIEDDLEEREEFRFKNLLNVCIDKRQVPDKEILMPKSKVESIAKLPTSYNESKKKDTIAKFDVSCNNDPNIRNYSSPAQDVATAKKSTGSPPDDKKGLAVSDMNKEILAAFLADDSDDGSCSDKSSSMKSLPLNAKVGENDNLCEDEIDYGYEKVEVRRKSSSSLDMDYGYEEEEEEEIVKGFSKRKQSRGSSNSSTKSSILFGELGIMRNNSFKLPKRISSTSFLSAKPSISFAKRLSQSSGNSGKSSSNSSTDSYDKWSPKLNMRSKTLFTLFSGDDSDESGSDTMRYRRRSHSIPVVDSLQDNRSSKLKRSESRISFALGRPKSHSECMDGSGSISLRKLRSAESIQGLRSSKLKRSKSNRISFALVRPKGFSEDSSDGSESSGSLRNLFKKSGSVKVLMDKKNNGFKSILKTKKSMKTRNSTYYGEDDSTNASKLSQIKQLHMSLANVDNLSGNDQMAAAATIISASANGGLRSCVHFSIGDKVLAFFSVLNSTLAKNDTEQKGRDPTKILVNTYGYPPGKGYAIEERRGPYNYVLCTIKLVHFEEFERYYTVIRTDTGHEQRANPEWLMPILTEEGKIAALKAARADLSIRDIEENNKVKTKPVTVLHRRCNICIQPIQFLRRRMTYFLLGSTPFSLRFQFSSINFSVIICFLFCFLDQIQLLCPIRFDTAFDILLVFIWFILVSELICEYLIRPKDYTNLLNSKDKYDPFLARYMMRFQFIAECISLIAFIPDLYEIFKGGWRYNDGWSLLACCVKIVTSQTIKLSINGQIKFIFIRMRIIGLVRQWKNMWLSRTYEQDSCNSSSITEAPEISKSILVRNDNNEFLKCQNSSTDDENKLKSAAHVGTALMVENFHRTTLLILFIVSVSPFFYITVNISNNTIYTMTELLQRNNLDFVENDTSTCQMLQQSSNFWLESMVPKTRKEEDLSNQNFLLWAQILPVRCPFQKEMNGVITACPPNSTLELCVNWEGSNSNSTPEYFADKLELRVGSIKTVSYFENFGLEVYNVTAVFNEQKNVQNTCISSILLQLTTLIVILGGLSNLQDNIVKLALNPLHRMLSIVLLYAKNPLASKEETKTQKDNKKISSVSNGKIFDEDEAKFDLGRFESEQLINAVTKIADLLRKCWGVAGANIISSNLARQQGGTVATFNPCVPGKLVYALFGFVAINDFASHLRNLEQDIMILINGVASVVHDEVYRWGYGTSGQCNKNLGDSFFMVFRIGEFEEVQMNIKKASEFIFSSPDSEATKKSRPKSKSECRRKNKEKKWSEAVVLASLPGIGAFTDRAIIGMLKSFASIHRNDRLRECINDFRLGAGVDAFTIGMIFGMDAGWAVEGAVGSEYKIDATYLSPHVNMAARMMSACRQFGVTILLSNAIQELVSEECKTKLRHIDTVTVKGSSLRQKIFTYDAREIGVDFFLYGQTDKKSDLGSELYNSSIWNTDQDLTAMRRHVTDEFSKKFNSGRDAYLNGDWENSIKYLKQADASMIQTILDGGYLVCDQDEYLSNLSKSERTKLDQKIGDGPSRCLIEYMGRWDNAAPRHWNGVRPLSCK